ncbi:MAG: lysozyme [Nitrospira sp.]|nr:lysozyme [Nitrospira sp.]
MASREIMAFIGRREGFVEVSYSDGKYLSWGFGHNGPEVLAGQRITLQDGIALFSTDLERFERGIKRELKAKLQPHEFDALLSAAYNLGVNGVASVIELLNGGLRDAALKKLRSLCKIKSADDGDPTTPPVFTESAGLKKRREAEAVLFETGDYGDVSRIPYWRNNPFKTKMEWVAFPDMEK